MFAISGVVYVKIEQSYLTLRYIATIRENKFTFSINDLYHRWEKLSPCSMDGSSNMKKIPAEHIENLQKTPSSK